MSAARKLPLILPSGKTDASRVQFFELLFEEANDGILLVGALALSFLLTGQRLRPALSYWKQWLPISFFAFLPFLIWNIQKMRLGLPSQMFMGEMSESSNIAFGNGFTERKPCGPMIRTSPGSTSRT